MTKRNRQPETPPEVPVGIVAVFFVIALFIAFAKFAARPNHGYASAAHETRVA